MDGCMLQNKRNIGLAWPTEEAAVSAAQQPNRSHEPFVILLQDDVGTSHRSPQLLKQVAGISYARKEDRLKIWSFLASTVSFGIAICKETKCVAIEAGKGCLQICRIEPF